MTHKARHRLLLGLLPCCLDSSPAAVILLAADLFLAVDLILLLLVSPLQSLLLSSLEIIFLWEFLVFEVN